MSETAKKPSRLTSAIAFMITSVLLVLPAVFRPPDLGVAICMSKRMFGVSCPGCGLTRSVTATMHLELATALRMHLFGPIFIGVIAALWALSLPGLFTGRSTLPDANARWVSFAAMGLMAGLIAYWIIRLVGGWLPP